MNYEHTQIWMVDGTITKIICHWLRTLYPYRIFIIKLKPFNSQDKYPVSVAKDLRMPQFTIELVTAKNCDNKIHQGNYSCLVAQFHLKRSISFHLIQNYLPSILIVAVSWVSFWMDIESVPGRISLGVITLLAVSSQASGTNVPQTSYVKARLIMMLCLINL